MRQVISCCIILPQLEDENTTMKKILVPTDFSPHANKAIDFAVQLAKKNQATLYVIHACENLYPVNENNVLSREDYNKQVTDDAFNNLELIRQSIEETEQVLVNIQLYNGSITDTITVAAAEHEADLIIMGTLGITGLKDKLFGSRTAAVIAHSQIPVLAIPLEYEGTTPGRFLLAINHFDEVNSVIDPVFDIAAALQAEVKLGVFTDVDEAHAAEFMADAREIHRTEEILKDKYPGLVITAEHLSGHRFEETIQAYMEANQVGLLAMLTHKRSLLGNIFHPSMTRRMTYHAKVPILAIPVSKQ